MARGPPAVGAGSLRGSCGENTSQAVTGAFPRWLCSSQRRRVLPAGDRIWGPDSQAGRGSLYSTDVPVTAAEPVSPHANYILGPPWLLPYGVTPWLADMPRSPRPPMGGGRTCKPRQCTQNSCATRKTPPCNELDLHSIKIITSPPHKQKVRYGPAKRTLPTSVSAPRLVSHQAQWGQHL